MPPSTRRNSRTSSVGASPGPSSRGGRTRRARGPTGRFASDPTQNADLPTVQGTASSSYGAPGMADLPNMLVYDSTRTLTETIEAGVEEAENRAAGMADEFHRDHSKTPSIRSGQRSTSVESEASNPPGRNDATTNRSVRPGILPPLEEMSELDDNHGNSRSRNTARPSISHTDQTVSFVQERGNHKPGRGNPSAKSPRTETIHHTRLPYADHGSWDLLFKIVLVSAAFLLFSIVLGGLVILVLGPDKSVAVCQKVPVLSDITSSFCLRASPLSTTTDRAALYQLTNDINNMWKAHDSVAREALQTSKHTAEIMDENNQKTENAFRTMHDNHITTKKVLNLLDPLQGWINSSGFLDLNYKYDHINHFAFSGGASILPGHTSETFERGKSRWWNKAVRAVMGYAHPLPAGAALGPWEEPGDCWCAALNSRGHHTAQFAVHVPNKIWPSGIIVEHIPQTATLRPRSTPKDIEVWAYVPNKRGRDWILSQGPWSSLQPKGGDIHFKNDWIRIQMVKYDVRKSFAQRFEMGTTLFPQSNETAVENVAIRATTNYGSKTDTCFYRVRLMGKLVEGLEVAEV